MAIGPAETRHAIKAAACQLSPLDDHKEQCCSMFQPVHPPHAQPELRPAASASLTFKVASYNMRKGIGLDRRRDPSRVLQVLNELDADIIALQEADRRFGTRASAIPPEMIDGESDYMPVLLDNRPLSIGWHGNALLVRKSAVVEESHMLHLPTLEPRGAVSATVQLGDQRVHVVGMHLDISGLRRRQQAEPFPL